MSNLSSTKKSISFILKVVVFVSAILGTYHSEGPFISPHTIVLCCLIII